MTYLILSGLQLQLSEICLSFVFKGGDSALSGGSLSQELLAGGWAPEPCHIHHVMEELCRAKYCDPKKQAQSSEEQNNIYIYNFSAYRYAGHQY